MPRTSTLNGLRSPCTSCSEPKVIIASTTCAHSQRNWSGSGSVWASRGAAARPSPMNSIRISPPSTCTGYGTRTPAVHNCLSVANSACDQRVASICRPKPDLSRTARFSRLSRPRRPSV